MQVDGALADRDADLALKVEKHVDVPPKRRCGLHEPVQLVR